MSVIPYNTGFFAHQFFEIFDKVVANQSEISHHNLSKSPNLGNLERFFSLYTPAFFPLNHKSTTNLDTKHLYKNSYGYYYLNLGVMKKTGG